jgi:hypothetical protein
VACCPSCHGRALSLGQLTRCISATSRG